MILPPSQADEFFALMGALDAYANRRLTRFPGLDTLEGMRAAHIEQRLEIRAALAARPAIVDDFVRENPFGLSEQGLADARPLRHTVRGRFFVERVLARHAIFMALADPAPVYAVQGLTERIDEALYRAQPPGVGILVDTALVPWRGRIVWDGIFSVLPIHIGSGIRSSFKAAYTKAKERGQIVTALGEEAAQKPKRAGPDWRPAVAQIAAATEALGKPDTSLQAAAFALLKGSALLAQAALDDDPEVLLDATKKADRALQRVIRALEER